MGIPMQKFDIRKVVEGEFGLFANCSFNQNEEVLRIPRKMFLTNETALSDSKLGKLALAHQAKRL